ncbi:O-antigen ligase domain-containing protein [Roseococcus sp. SYP-B2431]|nr:O-antigen ligase domain-containing protein [Roseococcus sp. SYP-B2431]
MAGLAAAAMHFAGALKSTPAVAALPLDVTALAAVGLLALLPLLLAGHRWVLAPGLGLPLAACGALWAWWGIAATWSPWSEGVADRLPEIMVIGPAMVAAGLAIGAEPAARRVFLDAAIGLGIFVGASVAWGIASDAVVLGGRIGADPTRVRVQYQVAGLAIACAAGLVALRATGAGGWRRIAWFGGLAALAAAVLLPGGRAAFLSLGLTVALAPALRWGLQGRVAPALLWLAAAPLCAAAALGVLLLDPGRAADLATLERLTRETGGVDSARAILWSEAWRWGGVWGLGPGGFPVSAGLGQDRGLHPHNHAIEAMVEGGAVGLLLWLAAFGGAALFMLSRLPRVEPDRAAAILALTLPLALTAMVSTDLGNRMTWFALGLGLSLGVEARRV